VSLPSQRHILLYSHRGDERKKQIRRLRRGRTEALAGLSSIQLLPSASIGGHLQPYQREKNEIILPTSGSRGNYIDLDV
jgi:hypothetical protein